MKKDLKDYLANKSYYKTNILAKQIKKDSELNALKLFYAASKRIPAYKDFLKKNKVNPDRIKKIVDFLNVPLMTKDNYIKHYSPKERSWDGDILNNHIISLSSGTTGEPVFWPRDLKSEVYGALQHEFLLDNILEVFSANKKTIIINGFALGNWIAGMFTNASLYLMNLKGYKFTLSTPGYSLEEVLKILKNFENEYDQFIITGHTPFLREIAENIKGLSKNKKIILLGTGQSVSENWRKYILDLLGSKDYDRTFVSLYGSADAALMGYETPLSIDIRKKYFDDSEISTKLFANPRFPALYQYDPRITFFESVNGELCITKYSGSPLIRYNIGDNGGVLEKYNLVSKLPKGFSSRSKKRVANNVDLPFVYLYGRDKFMVKIYGANVYSENIEIFLLNKFVRDKITGRYNMEIIEDEKYRPQFICRFEMKSSIKGIAEKTKRDLTKLLVKELTKVNSEYSDALFRMGKRALPKLEFYKYGHTRYFPLGKVVKTS